MGAKVPGSHAASLTGGAAESPEAGPSARRKTQPVAKYAVDLSRATSLLPWFQAAL